MPQRGDAIQSKSMSGGCSDRALGWPGREAGGGTRRPWLLPRPLPIAVTGGGAILGVAWSLLDEENMDPISFLSPDAPPIGREGNPFKLGLFVLEME